jgi:hypothetical protein
LGEDGMILWQDGGQGCEIDPIVTDDQTSNSS